jgi:hypothetical protein
MNESYSLIEICSWKVSKYVAGKYRVPRKSSDCKANMYTEESQVIVALFCIMQINTAHNQNTYRTRTVKVKVKESLYRPRGFQEVEAPRYEDNRHMKVVRLSAIRTGRLNPPGSILVLISVRG